MNEIANNSEETPPSDVRGGKYIRGVLNAVGGTIPFAGGVFSGFAGAWSEHEQERMNGFFRHWLKMIQDEMAEKERTIIEIMQRLDLHDEQIADRVVSREYQSLLKKGFREWAGTESETKRQLVRNILANAACSTVTIDDVVRMFLQWTADYSELHFSVIASIYNDNGVTRARIWEKVGKEEVREDSAEADLFKMLMFDLSTGHIIRQHREKDYAGHFLRKPAKRRLTKGAASSTMESAFEDTKGYELTELGRQFVHYAMTDLPVKIAYHTSDPSPSQAGHNE